MCDPMLDPREGFPSDVPTQEDWAEYEAYLDGELEDEDEDEEYEYEDDGQPSEYEEWQDLYGGDVEEYGTFGDYAGADW